VMRPTQTGGLEVVEVRPESPAVDVGIVKGDLVLKINGKGFREYKRGVLRALLKQEGSTINLLVKRADKTEELKIKLRRLL